MRGKLFVLEQYGRKDAYLKYLQTVILKTFRDDRSQPCWPGGDSGRTRRPLREVLEEGPEESLKVQEGSLDPTGFRGSVLDWNRRMRSCDWVSTSC